MKWKYLIAILLIVSLTGCGDKKSISDIKLNTEESAMQLEENYCPLPTEAYNDNAKTKMERMPSIYLNKAGQLEMLYANTQLVDNSYYETNFYTAQWKGSEWKSTLCPWSETIDFSSDTGEGILDVRLDTEKEIYYAIQYIYNGDRNEKERMDSMYEYQLLCINPADETVEDISTGDFYSNVTKEPKGATPSMQFSSGDGTAAVLFANGKMSIFDLDKQKKMSDLNCSSASFVIDENFVYAYVNGEIALYDKKSGEKESGIKISEPFDGECRLFLGTEGQLYMANHKGVYVLYETDGEFVQLIDASKYPVLADKSNYIMNLVAINDSQFYIDYWNEADTAEPEKLYSYTLSEK